MNDSVLFLRDAARVVLSDEKNSVDELKTLYRELLQRVQNMVATARVESFGEAYARCRHDFKALPRDRLSDLEPALTRLEYLVAAFESRVKCLESVRSRRGGAAMTSPVAYINLQAHRAHSRTRSAPPLWHCVASTKKRNVHRSEQMKQLCLQHRRCKVFEELAAEARLETAPLSKRSGGTLKPHR